IKVKSEFGAFSWPEKHYFSICYDYFFNVNIRIENHRRPQIALYFSIVSVARQKGAGLERGQRKAPPGPGTRLEQSRVTSPETRVRRVSRSACRDRLPACRRPSHRRWHHPCRPRPRHHRPTSRPRLRPLPPDRRDGPPTPPPPSPRR